MDTRIALHMQQHTVPLRVPRAGAVQWDDEALHAEAHRADPERYALSALVPAVPPAQRARILLQLLLSSWAGLDAPVRATLQRVVRVLALGLPPADVLTVLLAVKRRRANHKHVTRAAVTVLLEHPHAGELIQARRGVAQACFEHALGRATARGFLSRPGLSTLDAERVTAIYRHLEGTRPPAPPAAAIDLDHIGERPATVTATNRGDLAATLVHLMRGGPSADLAPAAERYTDALVAGLPRYTGTVALVLDDSTSMRGYGEREWAVASQVAAFRRVLDRVCARLVVVRVGGVTGSPGGATDLATGVLDALAAKPDVVAVASDGYENVHPGDLARVTATLPRIGVRTPILMCQATYGHSDDLTLRRPAPDLPQRTFWHSDDLVPLILWILSQVDSADAGRWVDAELRRRLTHSLEGAAR